MKDKIPQSISSIFTQLHPKKISHKALKKIEHKQYVHNDILFICWYVTICIQYHT